MSELPQVPRWGASVPTQEKKKNLKSEEIEKFQEIPEMFRIDNKCPAGQLTGTLHQLPQKIKKTQL